MILVTQKKEEGIAGVEIEEIKTIKIKQHGYKTYTGYTK